MHWRTRTLLAALIATTAATAPPSAADDLSWLAGYWLSCSGGREVSETWSVPHNGILLGHSFNTKGERVQWEQTRIAPSDATTLTFHAQPSGQPAAEFKAIEVADRRAVFENKAHDFPQRVIYRRDGDVLVGRIEGSVGGKERSSDWRYEKAELNAHCPVTP